MHPLFQSILAANPCRSRKFTEPWKMLLVNAQALDVAVVKQTILLTYYRYGMNGPMSVELHRRYPEIIRDYREAKAMLHPLFQSILQAHGAPASVDPRDPDPSRHGIFRDHNCWKCKDGVKPCVAGSPSRCEYPHARND